MFGSVHNIKSFYASRAGRLVRRILVNQIRVIWPELKGLRVLGVGYAPPFLRPLRPDAERVCALMPPALGVHFWPEGEKGLACLGAEDEWPFETESVDRLILVHSVEHAHAPEALFQEAWRVLKSNGRIILIVPNRMGLWARADWTPFGHGAPYSASQITHYLRDNLFVHERTEKALFMPPFRSFLFMRLAYLFESIGRAIFPGLGGVHIIEASKQVYAGSARGRAAAGRRRVMVVEAAPTA